ncbi:DUF485 domain-containing protein [Corallococcus praedator]|uniref:DUF485 domain-containing protein n=1 Tax=Corallococcus praedator TaxID=2316724 RepID=A0ABX9QMS6_9BACT|nr:MULTISPECIES: DUF485 domain-containing protein [Corallococcus]RKH18066.1 DUF485 domain-containing protein [Corallococcus sp. CA047B]RKH34196.1 DUF485 domain-containing protein [Corallococcus sp. CA031C]RKI12954.1 DUF485 domain-containing protein [Corallococcus praedator]
MYGNSKDDVLKALAAARWRVAGALTVAMLVTYLGFILLVAFNRPLMGQQLIPGLSIGIVLGAVTILVAWVLTGLYILWANRKYDHILDELRR